MTSLSPPDALPTAPQAPDWVMRLLTVALGLVVIVAAMISGMSFAADDKKMIVLPLAAVVGLALAVFASTQFFGFVLLLLGIRSSIDALSLTSSTGATSTTGNEVLDRGINPSGLLGILFLLAAMLWLATRYFSGTHVKASSLTWWLVGFWLIAVVSLVSSHVLTGGATESLRIMAVAMMFVVLEQLITSRKALNHVLVAAFASLLIPLGYTLFGILTGNAASEEKSGLTRLLGTFTQSNAYGRYLSFMIIFGVAIYPYVKANVKVLLRILLAFSVVFLFLTLTITAILATSIGVVLVAVMQRRHALIAAVVAVAAIAAIAAPGLTTRVDTLQTQPQAGSGPSGNTLAWRFGYWTEVLPLANRNPVTGIGIGSTAAETDAAKQPHNDFVRAYVETGLVGLVIYIGMLASMVSTCRRAARRSVSKTYDHGVATGALACAVCCIVESMASNVITNSVALWYLVAFLAAAGYIARTPEERLGTAKHFALPVPA